MRFYCKNCKRWMEGVNYRYFEGKVYCFCENCGKNLQRTIKTIKKGGLKQNGSEKRT